MSFTLGRKRMRARIALIPLALIAIAIAAGCGSNGDQADGPGYGYGPPPPDTEPAAAPATVSTATGDLGTYLVGPDGRTLYLFVKDGGTKSTCYGECATAWPPLLTTDTPKAAGDAKAGLLGITNREDGTAEVTYAGHPLYYYAGDAEPGDTTGQGSRDAWYVLAPSGEAIEGPTPDTATR